MAEFILGRLKFVWKGAWVPSTSYIKDDIIRYGGKTFTCLVGHTSGASSSGSFETDLTAGKWEQMSDGIAWRGDWAPSAYYKVADVARFGGKLYICATAHTSDASYPDGFYNDLDTKWQLYSDGLTWEGQWETATYYVVGDIVRYGGRSYICTVPHLSQALLEDDQDIGDSSLTKWQLYADGIAFVGTWNPSSFHYKVNDIVSYGGQLYICNTHHTSIATFDTIKFTIFANGLQFEGVYDNATTYQPGDVVTYGSNSYIATQTTVGNLPTDPTYWNVINQGLVFRGVYSDATQYYKGDIVTRGAYSYTALRDTIGDSPSTATSDWGQLNPGQDFRSNWNVAVSYTKGDVVRYGAYTYIALRDTVGDNPDVSASDWEQLNPGQEWKGDYNNAISYTEGDIVAYGPYVYIAKQDTTGNLPTNATYWDQFTSGQEWQSDWAVGTNYYKGDIVRYGAYTYIALRDTVGDNPSTATSDWTQLTPGQEWQNIYDNGTAYTKGDLVQFGGYVYIALQDTTANLPTNTTYWQIFNKGYTFIGIYSAVSSYKPGELVTYGGYVYAAKAVTTGNAPSNSTYWELFSKGFEYRSDYNGATTYRLGDVVKYGARLYISIQEGSGNLPTNGSFWSLYMDGFEWGGTWADASAYQIGDIVRYGARTYVCILGHTSSIAGGLIPTNATYWNLLNDGFRSVGDYTDATQYLIGDVVTYGGRSYVCVLGHTSNTATNIEPPNATYWNLIAGGLSYKGNWSSIVEYELGDVVYYLGSSYVSTASDNLNKEPGTAPEWDTLSQGDTNAIMTTRGDIVRQGSGGAERLPLGPNTSYLYSNGTDVKWGQAAPTRVYYVHDNGNDTTGDGKTLATAWRTIAKACTATYSVGQCVIKVSSGIYDEVCPIKVGRNVCIEADALGSVTIQPAAGASLDGTTLNANSEVFHVNNGARIRNFMFKNFGAGSVMVALDPGTGPSDSSVWITSQSPYIQNCTSFSTGGTGLFVDGALHAGGYKSVVANDWTQINSGGIGVHAINDSRVELVSVFTYYCDVGYLAESGGKIRALNGSCSYGEYGARASGYSLAETPLTGNFELNTAIINSVQEIESDVTIARSFQDEDRTIYTIGFTNPTYPYPPSPTSTSKAYIAKFSSGGDLEYQTILEKSGGFAAALSITAFSNNSYVGCNVYDGVNTRATVVKLNANGEILWQKTISGSIGINGLTNDGQYIYVLFNHETFGVGWARITQAGVIQYSAKLDTSSLSINTLTGIDLIYMKDPVLSDVTYAAAGDATAQGQIYVLARDSVTNQNYLIRTTNTGTLEAQYELGSDFTIFKMDADFGSEDGIYIAMVGKDDLTGDALLMRVDILGNITWQRSLEFLLSPASGNSQYYNVYPFGDEIYAQGTVLDSVEKGLIVKFQSDGTLVFAKTIEDTLGMSFRGIHIDGVNAVLPGIKNELDSVLINVDREVTDLGTATGYSIVVQTPTVNTPTVASRTVYTSIDRATLGTSLSDSTLAVSLTSPITRTVVGTRTGFQSIGRGLTFDISGLARKPKAGSVLQITGDTTSYFVIEVTGFDIGDSSGLATVVIDPPIQNSKVPADGTTVVFREAFSQVRMTGHDFLDIGSGNFATTAYPVLLKDDYAQTPNQARETDETGGGRCFYTSTDQDGNFRVGAYFRVDQATGRATLSSEDFDLTGLNELQLGSIRAGKRGASINEFSTDGTMSDVSDSAVPTERAVVTYVQAQIAAATATSTAVSVATGW